MSTRPRCIAAATTALLTLAAPATALAQSDSASTAADTALASPAAGVVLLIVLPLMLVLASAFVKVAVVLGLLRNAFGSADVPPPLVVTALAVLISLVVMGPVAERTLDAAGADASMPATVDEARTLWERSSAPLLDFLEHNSAPDHVERFAAVVTRVRSAEEHVEPRRLDVLLPAFVASELSEAFQMGLLLLLPFLVLDLVVAAVLAAGGLSTVQPAVVALPLKLLLFVTLDGWAMLLEALMLGYS